MNKSQYFIPVNFTPDGEILGRGRRNWIEAVLFGGFGGLMVWWFAPVHGQALVITMLVSIILPGAIGVIGVNGLSFTQFLKVFFTYRTNRRLIKKPTSKDMIARSKALMAKTRKLEKRRTKEAKRNEKVSIRADRHLKKQAKQEELDRREEEMD